MHIEIHRRKPTIGPASLTDRPWVSDDSRNNQNNFKIKLPVLQPQVLENKWKVNVRRQSSVITTMIHGVRKCINTKIKKKSRKSGTDTTTLDEIYQREKRVPVNLIKHLYKIHFKTFRHFSVNNVFYWAFQETI